MEIKEIENKQLFINPQKMNLDDKLDTNKDQLPDPLPNSSFSMAIVGSSGSGKTSLMSSIITAPKKNNVRQSYRKLFSKIILCSPTLSSFKSNVWGRVKGKYEEFNLEFLNELEDISKEEWEEKKQTIAILDDIGSTLKKDKKAEQKLISMLQNRRHIGLSVIILVQKWRDLPLGVRTNLTNVAVFRPKNNQEKEAIFNELLPMKKDKWDEIYKYIYDDDRYAFLFIDLSLKKSSSYRYFKKFNEIQFN